MAEENMDGVIDDREERPFKGFVNLYRTRKIGKDHLVTTDHGTWVMLDGAALGHLRRKNLDAELAKNLEAAGVLLTKKSEKGIVEKYRKRNDFLFSGPTIHTIDLTSRCCDGCTCSKELCDMREETAIRVMEFILDTPSKKLDIIFRGGEPLLNLGVLKSVVGYAKAKSRELGKKVFFSVHTDLLNMDDDTLSWLYKEGIGIHTRLDGPEGVHSFRTCRGEGNYSSVKRWIRRIRAVYGNGPTVTAVVNEKSLGCSKEIVDEYLSFGLDTIKVSPAEAERRYDAEGFARFWEETITYIMDLNRQGTSIRERRLSAVLRKILTDDDPGDLELRSAGNMITGQLCYSYDGGIYPSYRSRMFDFFRLGAVSECSFKEVIGSENARVLMSASVNDGTLCDACVYKPYCGLSLSSVYAESGQLIPKLAESFTHKTRLAMFDFIFGTVLLEKELVPKLM